ncbi:MAG: hypothetical protein EBU90_15560 [Proteobacteria bacterium]|nr:hypothetical protein [Pseudomonadota bacterium]NBP13566.1 hypothetical protein [bacterium]
MISITMDKPYINYSFSFSALLVVIVTIIAVNVYYYHHTFITLRQHIFPFQIEDMPFDAVRDKKYIKQITKRSYRPPDSSELKFLVQYKKFCDHKGSFSFARDPEIDLMVDVISKIKNVPGDIAEFGVWKGGMAMWIQALMIYHRLHLHKRLILFDTFGEFPCPDTEECPQDTKLHPLTTYLFEKPYSVASVQKYFDRFQLLHDNVVFVPGTFANTCPNQHIKKLALLRIDCDYYQPTLHILNSHYFDISPGGFVVIDDYNNQYLGCRQAVLDFRKKHNINNPIIGENDNTGAVYWQISK